MYENAFLRVDVADKAVALAGVEERNRALAGGVLGLAVFLAGLAVYLRMV